MQNYADIIGRSITQPIIVGRQLKGAIVAFGTPDAQNPSAGTIASVRIGLDAPAGPAVFGPGAPAEPYAAANFQRGMTGVAAIPHDMNPAAHPNTVPPNNPWFFTDNRDGGTLDALVRAETAIGTIKVASMTLVHPTGFKCRKPRIESPIIGTLRVEGPMEAGVIWSGRLEIVNGEVQDNIENNYATVGEFFVNCVSRLSDIWFQDCPTAVIDNHMVGELHLPKLRTPERILIGGELGTAADSCGVHSGNTCFDFVSDERSPRTIRAEANEEVAAARGNIFMLQPFGLEGQIVINADDVAEDPSDPFWDGTVTVGADERFITIPSGVIVLDPDLSSGPDRAPFYNRLSADLGGGAVGLGRFHLHGLDCVPPYVPGVFTGSVLESAFNELTAKPVAIETYGRTRRNLNVMGGYLRIEANPGNDDCGTWQDVTSGFVIRIPTVSNNTDRPRETLLSRASGSYPRPGKYRVIMLETENFNPAIACKDVLSPTYLDGDDLPGVVWPIACAGTSEEEPVYMFYIASDCDSDGFDDAVVPPTNCDLNCDLAEFDGRMGITLQDLFDFLGAYFNTPTSPPGANCWLPPAPRLDADINNSGCVTVQDIFDFLAVYFSCQ